MVMVDLASVTVAESVGRHVKGPSKRFNSLTESQGKKFLAAPSMGEHGNKKHILLKLLFFNFLCQGGFSWLGFFLD